MEFRTRTCRNEVKFLARYVAAVITKSLTFARISRFSTRPEEIWSFFVGGCVAVKYADESLGDRLPWGDRLMGICRFDGVAFSQVY